MKALVARGAGFVSAVSYHIMHVLKLKDAH